ncbi:bifunctional acetate--CoA ligase family protein/GNAT family N-acetyltransferase [Marinomonas mediterranea]|jgi:Acyl-CoA synthetase (NDP forming)|uniref:GCN5-related N-acetyltransferase n=1 Tax=Marinomonas mediterranea (strain ATCC 700492 / JCM 21426 / NBRC 103028 / MMB-1) TaxID=717774 RepID=F2JUH1_MARM1|nr:GNAT family N-acetyltransferase [Marinomonas mediterranea]ADZ92790.1 GCN5-related N-acetyltransferase [Marinomonas mediterranea MMB-1]WCN18815.1 GNAT family N-acetyltransferase [Marinomonas mediterranea MMB-1]
MTQHALHTLFSPHSVIALTGKNPNDPLMLALLSHLCAPSTDKRKSFNKITLVGCLPNGDNLTSYPHSESLSALSSQGSNTSDTLAILCSQLDKSLENTIKECSEAGINALLMLTWVPDSPAHIQRLLRRYNMRLLGPNSFGVCTPSRGFNAWLGLTSPISGRLALLSQSGTIASAVVDWATWQGIGFSHVVATGTPIDVMPHQVMDYLSNDFQTQSILMYIQNVGNPTRFLSSLRSTSRSKPVAVVTEHSLGADDRVLDAALSRTGAVRGHRLNDLVAAASVMTNARRVQEGSLIIIGNGAGPGELAAQKAQELNVDLLTPSLELQTRLESVMDNRGSIGSVTTVWASCPTDLFIDLAETALSDHHCGAVLLMLSPTALIDLQSLQEQVVQLHKKQRKLVMVCLMGGGHIVDLRTRINEASIPTFRTPETAIEGYQFLELFQRNQKLAKQSPDSHAFRFQVDVNQARQHIQERLTQGMTDLSHRDLEHLFTLFHIAISPSPQHSLLSTPISLRVFQDATFGPVIALSFGGSHHSSKYVEAVGLPPLNTILAKDLIARALPNTECFELEALLRNLSSMVCELPELLELHLMEVAIHEDGSISTNASASITPRPDLRRYEHLAIQPYPRQWLSEAKLNSTTTTTIRPVLPRDAWMMAEFVKNLSHESRYFRFIANISELTPKMLANMTHIDYDREMALLAVIEQNNESKLIGAARYIDNFDDKSCEFAVVIGDDYQGLGLASYLMRKLFIIANDKGLRIMKGIVLSENVHMIEFCKRLGFSIQRDPDDYSQVIATVKLTDELIENSTNKLKKLD